ncbi:MAG: STAS domain-containing protein [Lentisphaerae bacterium]|nr:STAS domain-containing protein [Lentisphaerota bacterium]
MKTKVHSVNIVPKLVTCLRNYTLRDFASDLIAGLTVGLVALPLAMAFGIASGVTPQAGIYTAIVAGFLISALGGSRTQVGGPTGAFVVVIAGIIAKHGIDGLYMVSIMAGVILMLMAVTGLGLAVKFIPRPVTIGFTNGIALLIASTQIKDFLGLSVESVPSAFVPRMVALWQNIGSFSAAAIAMAAGSLLLIIFTPRLTRRVPGTIVALLVGTVITAAMGLPIDTIQSKFGGIPSGFPDFVMPKFDPGLISKLLPSAVTVAFLAALESLLSAVVADGMTGDRHNSNAELMAQGVANFAVPFFGGIPATGAIARTATNIRSGAKSPIAGIIHAVVLLLILLVAAPLARFIPLATLAAVLLVVAYNMGEWREIPAILRQAKSDKAVWMVTFTLTVLADLTVAVQTGMILAAMLYIQRVARTTTVSIVTDDYIEQTRADLLQDKDVPPYVTILRIHGPFLFGTTDKLLESAHDPSRFAPIVILRLRNMTAIDNTGLHAIAKLGEQMRKAGKKFLICGALGQPAQLIAKSNLANELGSENVLPNIDAALVRARAIADDFEGVGLHAAASFTRRLPT